MWESSHKYFSYFKNKIILKFPPKYQTQWYISHPKWAQQKLKQKIINKKKQERLVAEKTQNEIFTLRLPLKGGQYKAFIIIYMHFRKIKAANTYLQLVALQN